MSFNVFMVLLCIKGLSAVDKLCSNEKSSNKCLCERIIHKVTSEHSFVADCTRLAIDNFPDIQQFPDDITDIDLSVNNIQTLDSSAVNISSGTLRKLILSNNVINYVNAKFFEGLPKLYILELDNNISSWEDGNIFSKQKELIILILSFNHIKYLPEAIFDPLKELRYLDLSHNPLGEFLMGSKDVLGRSLGIASSITYLMLDNVGLSDLSPDYFSTFQKLTNLELEDNNFTIIPTVPKSLEYLDISGNSLTFVSAEYLDYPSLRYLMLSLMPSLTLIHQCAFCKLPSLETLAIIGCPNVSNFPELAFGLLSKSTDIHLKRLILRRIGIRSLSYAFKQMFVSMEHVDLIDNPWECDCNILWLQEFVELFKGHEMRCASPKHLRDKNILELTHLDLPHCFPGISENTPLGICAWPIYLDLPQSFPEIYGKTFHRILMVILMTTVPFLLGFIFCLMIRYPKSVLLSRCEANNYKKSKNSRMSPDSALGMENEKKLVKHIMKLRHCGFAPTHLDIWQMAFKFAVSLNIPHKFENGPAENDWLCSFLLRNPELPVRNAESVSLVEGLGDRVKNYFELLRSVLEESNLFDKPSHIFNLGETVLQPNDHLAEKMKEAIRVMACCNAEGSFLPPTYIFQGKNLISEYQDGMLSGSRVYMNEESAYITSDLLFNWLKNHFVPRKPAGTVLLVVDSHSSYYNVEMLEFAEHNDIVMISIPSHTKHWLQPLDRAVFKALKSAYNVATDKWLRENSSQESNRFRFGDLLSEAWYKAAVTENAIFAFKETGIYPYSSSIIPEYVFLPDSEVPRRNTLLPASLRVTTADPSHINNAVDLKETYQPNTSGVLENLTDNLPQPSLSIRQEDSNSGILLDQFLPSPNFQPMESTQHSSGILINSDNKSQTEQKKNNIYHKNDIRSESEQRKE